MTQQSGRKMFIEGLNRVLGTIKEGTAGGPLLLKPVLEAQLQRLQKKAGGMLGKYENFIGISHVKEAQARVLQTEMSFQETQKERRNTQQQLQKIQDMLRSLRLDIDRTPRGDHRYLELIKTEIEMIKEEREIRTLFEEQEGLERETFSELSNALRMSHEKERAQSEKTKYWSVLGSIVGAFLGIVGTTLNSRMRHHQTQAVLGQTSNQVEQIEEAVRQLAFRLDKSNLLQPIALVEALQQFIISLEEKQKELDSKTQVLTSATISLEDKIDSLFNTLPIKQPSGFLETLERWTPEILVAAGGALIGVIIYRSF